MSLEQARPILFWSIYPIFWVNFLGFPIIGILLIGEFGWVGALYFPVIFGVMLWLSDWADLVVNPSTTWMDHFWAVFRGAIGGPLVCLGLLGCMWVFAGIIDGQAAYSIQKSQCEKQSISIHEYNQCMGR